MSNEIDPFGNISDSKERESTPTAKFPDVGTVVSGTILEIQDPVQGTDFDTQLPAVNKDGTPATNVVITLDVNGEKQAVWARYWAGSDGRWAPAGSMFSAIGAARQSANAPLQPGGTLSVKHTGLDGRRKLFAAQYKPGAAPAAADPFDNPPF